MMSLLLVSGVCCVVFRAVFLFHHYAPAKSYLAALGYLRVASLARLVPLGARLIFWSPVCGFAVCLILPASCSFLGHEGGREGTMSEGPNSRERTCWYAT